MKFFPTLLLGLVLSTSTLTAAPVVLQDLLEVLGCQDAQSCPLFFDLDEKWDGRQSVMVLSTTTSSTYAARTETTSQALEAIAAYELEPSTDPVFPDMVDAVRSDLAVHVATKRTTAGNVALQRQSDAQSDPAVKYAIQQSWALDDNPEPPWFLVKAIHATHWKRSTSDLIVTDAGSSVRAMDRSLVRLEQYAGDAQSLASGALLTTNEANVEGRLQGVETILAQSASEVTIVQAHAENIGTAVAKITALSDNGPFNPDPRMVGFQAQVEEILGSVPSKVALATSRMAAVTNARDQIQARLGALP